MPSFFDAKWPVFTVSAGMHHPDYQLYAIIYKFANEYGGIPVTVFCEKSPSRAASLWGTKIVIFRKYHVATCQRPSVHYYIFTVILYLCHPVPIF